ncbi:hypothetical protein PL321_10110 [Caloramator sp. mosi_1]|nr:hypothetical protein [Caloramator sp. mosi_1]WDC83174.1 hypothetical protein PL321_10110 [Caloramator sp. mosi_1]
MFPKNLLLEEDNNSKYTLNEIYDMLRLEKEKKNAEKRLSIKNMEKEL